MADESAGHPSLAGRHILLGVSGGIAAYKAVHLLRLLTEAGADVQVVMTQAATRFVGPATFAALSHHAVHTDVFEEASTVLHVRLAHEADLAVVAPATANVLARLSLGLADDLLSSVLLEASCPLVLAPAMHTGMWSHPATQEHVHRLTERGALLVGPGEGPLAAGDQGTGRMAEPEEIFLAVLRAGTPDPARQDLKGRHILVTAGPTHEPIDAVRFLGNRSSGKMGFAVASEASSRGATVTLVAGPVSLAGPAGVDVVRVETSEEMAGAVFDRARTADAVIMAAAVADWRPSEVSEGKLKKEGGAPRLALEPTVDILAELGREKGSRVLVGFAAETGDLEAEARRKLSAKNLDLIVVNEVGRPDTGFGSETNRAAIIGNGSGAANVRLWTKPELASAICDRLAELLTAREAR
jgi:phosphopantothenoylcysteine decarboxylase/phosphopantothenate--cysteine ligase